MPDTYSKDKDGKLQITKTITQIETVSSDDLKKQLARLISDRDNFIQKTQIEIDSWNQAINDINNKIQQAIQLGVDSSNLIGGG